MDNEFFDRIFKIDRRFITDNLLDRHFPILNGQNSRIYRLEQLKKYSEYKKQVNQKRKASGKSPFTDADMAILLEKYRDFHEE
jgi:hypothetical protein